MNSTLGTLEKCELEAAELMKEGKFYEEIGSLIENIPNLLKVEQFLASHKKKFEELRQIVMQNQKNLKIIESCLKSLKSNFSQHVENKSKLNEEENDLIRIIEIKKFEVQMKKECCLFVKMLDGEIDEEKRRIFQILEKSKQEIKDFNDRYSAFEASAIDEAANELENFEDALISQSVEFIKSKSLKIIDEKTSSFEQELTEEILSLESLINR